MLQCVFLDVFLTAVVRVRFSDRFLCLAFMPGPHRDGWGRMSMEGSSV
jgi:hypothetical protein